MPPKHSQWMNPSLSSRLAGICERGEDQTTEFKVDFPKQASDLSQEFAAMATAGGGTVYMGINDEGEAVGLDLSTPKLRDDLQQRTYGILSQIRPAAKASIEFGATPSGATIAAIKIHKPDHPIYWVNHRPYVRELTSARPMHPDEVVVKIQKWIAKERRSKPAAKKPVSPQNQTSKDLLELRDLMSTVDLRLMENAFESLMSDYMTWENIVLFDSFSDQISRPSFHISDKTLSKKLDSFFSSWRAVIDHQENFDDTRDWRIKRFISKKRIPYAEWSLLHADFRSAVKKLRQEHSSLLEYLRQHYPDLDLRETSAAAAKRLSSVLKGAEGDD